MIFTLLVVQESANTPGAPKHDAKLSRRRAYGKWIAALGWLVALCGVACLLAGLSDVQNLIVLAAIGIVFVPIGLLLVSNGHILAGLAAIERNTRGKSDSEEDWFKPRSSP